MRCLSADCFIFHPTVLGRLRGGALLQERARIESILVARDSAQKRNMLRMAALEKHVRPPLSMCAQQFIPAVSQPLSDHQRDLPSVDSLVSTLASCLEKQDAGYARCIYALACSRGLEAHRLVEYHAMRMFVECENVSDAQNAFNRSHYWSLDSWISLILTYFRSADFQRGLNLYIKSQEHGLCLSAPTFVAILKACSHLKDLDRGREIYMDILVWGLEGNLHIASTLIAMYTQCGSVVEARRVFYMLHEQNTVVWTALIAGYADHGSYLEALDCFELLQLEGFPPDAPLFSCILRVCSSIVALEKGQEIHRAITGKGFEKEISVGSALVDMYLKCGLRDEALNIFHKLPVRNVVSWTALIDGYVEREFALEALTCFEQMQLEGIAPDAVSFACVIKACRSAGLIEKASEVNNLIVCQGYDRSHSVGSTLVDMYAKCGLIVEAQELFNKLAIHNLESWNGLISGKLEHGLPEDTLKHYEQMQQEGVSADSITFCLILKSCSCMEGVDKGHKIHNDLVSVGFEQELLIGSSLINMYFKSGSVAEASEVFNIMPLRDVALWNALITGYAECGSLQEAFNCLREMQMDDVSPNAVTFICVLKACGSAENAERGIEMHTAVAKSGFETDLFLATGLVGMYAKCGLFLEAQEIFEKLQARSVVLWNALLSGYAEHGCCREALCCCEQMESHGETQDAATFACLFKACGIAGAIDKGQLMHTKATQKGLETDCHAGSSLVDMYAKSGLLLEAQNVMNNLHVKNIVSWNALVSGYAGNGRMEEAIKCFEQMPVEDVSPDALTYVSILNACWSMEALDKAQEFHAEVVQKGYEQDVLVCNSLVGFYGKCGLLEDAQGVFNKLPYPTVASWSAILKGCSVKNEGTMAVHLFNQMLEQGIKPDAIALTCLLSACSHNSLLIQGEELFQVMREEYGMVPDLNHFTCMVDLLARSGNTHDAEKLIALSPYCPSRVMWRALLNACRFHQETELGEFCFKNLLELNLQGNLHALPGRWNAA